LFCSPAEADGGNEKRDSQSGRPGLASLFPLAGGQGREEGEAAKESRTAKSFTSKAQGQIAPTVAMFEFSQGIRITGTSLWLDAERAVETSCVSHAHSDHIRGHAHVIATDKTIRFLTHRLGRVKATALRFGEPFELEAPMFTGSDLGDGCRVTLLPAGHILGSSQILVERNGARLLYSGDFQLAQSAAAEPIDIPSCDLLIVESTFGLPRYRFPTREELTEQLIEFIDACLARQAVPVVLAYALGKAQEVMKVLSDRGYALVVHSSIFEIASLYEAFGIFLQSYEKLQRGRDLKGKVLVIPPHARRLRLVEQIERKHTVLLSGWAADPGSKYRYGVDEALPWSDHADFADLLRYVEMTKAKKVYTTHGFEEFALILRQKGFDAEPLKPSAQIELF